MAAEMSPIRAPGTAAAMPARSAASVVATSRASAGSGEPIGNEHLLKPTVALQ